MKISYLLSITIALQLLPAKFASPLTAQTAPAPTQIPQVEWQPFCAAEGQFAIDMPGNPKINVETFSNKITTYTYRSILKDKENQETYLLRHFELDELRLSNSNIRITLNTAVDFFVVAANAKLLQVRDITLGGYPGKEFEFQPLSPKEPVGIGQVFLVDRRIYGLVASTPKQENAQKFFDSFQLF